MKSLNSQSGRLSGKTALITGASRGIGSEIARAFAREGADLILSATSLGSLQIVKEELETSGVSVISCPAD